MTEIENRLKSVVSKVRNFRVFLAFDFPVFLVGRFFPWICSMNSLLLRYLMLSFQFIYLSTTILHIIINNLVVVLLKSSKY